MAYVNDAGLIVPEENDTLKIAYFLKARDYGRYDRFPPLADSAPLTWPQIVSHHITDSLIDPDDYDIDMLARGKIYAAMQYHTQLYFGLNGQACQIIPVSRAAMGVSGNAMFRGAKHEVNNLAFHIEWISMTTDLKGNKYKVDPKTGKTMLLYHTDPKREDLVERDGRLWLRVPDAQKNAVGEVLAAIYQKCQLNKVNLFHGHYALSRGTHIDPGPVVIDALKEIGTERFDMPEEWIPAAGELKPLPYPIADNPPRSF